MPGVTRKNIVGTTGHGGYPSRSDTPNGSDDVIVNGYGVVRIDDTWPDHTDPGPPDTHSGIQTEGSSTVFANGKGIARIDDSISCGDVVAEGSPDVICG
jgi:uncharacterized Zn-binding protein involved in type VI secretion